MIDRHLRVNDEEGKPLTLASLSQHFVPLTACFSLCVLIVAATVVRWQDLPWDRRWIGPEEEITDVDLSSGNAFTGSGNNIHVQFDCKSLTAIRCARVMAFRDFVARHDFRNAERPPSAPLLLDLDSQTLTVHLKSGKVVEKYVYDYTENANFNSIARALSELDQDELTQHTRYFHRP